MRLLLSTFIALSRASRTCWSPDDPYTGTKRQLPNGQSCQVYWHTKCNLNAVHMVTFSNGTRTTRVLSLIYHRVTLQTTAAIRIMTRMARGVTTMISRRPNLPKWCTATYQSVLHRRHHHQQDDVPSVALNGTTTKAIIQKVKVAKPVWTGVTWKSRRHFSVSNVSVLLNTTSAATLLKTARVLGAMWRRRFGSPVSKKR